MRGLVFALMLAGCAKAPAPAVPVPEVEATPDTGVAMPAGAAAARQTLQARDASDLPTAEALGADAREGLAWLATHDDMLVIRQRALMVLAGYDDAATGALCQGILESDATPQERSGAAICLGGQALAEQPALQAALVTALEDEDPRVGIAAADALVGLDTARADLERVGALETVPADTRAHISGLLAE